MEDLRQAVETTKRILIKEKLDKQLTGHTSTSPCMNIRDGTERKVSFNARYELGDKIDKLTAMMGKLAAKDSNDKRPFKSQIYKSRGSFPQCPNRTYNQRNYQNRNRLGNRQTVETEDSMGVIDPDFSKMTQGTIFKKILGDMEVKTVEENIEITGIMATIEVGIDQEKDCFQEIIAIIGIKAQVTVYRDQDLELVPIETE